MMRMRPRFLLAFVQFGLLASGSCASSAAYRGTVEVLHNFGSQGDGVNPESALIQDANGNLFGTTIYGGSHGPGTVFKFSPTGTETILHSFTGGKADGAYPASDLISDGDGNLYGTASSGGHGCSGSGCGVVFKLAPDGTETVLHFFKGGLRDGASPSGSLTRDNAGNLFGTASQGGDVECGGGCGLVFKIDPAGVEKKIHFFGGVNHNDGAYPEGNLLLDDGGNVFGITAEGTGTVFKLASDGTETVLHVFGTVEDDGITPRGLTWGSSGQILGTTYRGGGSGCGGDGCGTIFSLSPDGTETVLYRFNGKDGNGPNSKLVMDDDGALYGTTSLGGAKDHGVVFKFTQKGRYTVLHSFCPKRGCVDGWNPQGGLLIGQDGYLYGTTVKGGTDAISGVIYRVGK